MADDVVTLIETNNGAMVQTSAPADPKALAAARSWEGVAALASAASNPKMQDMARNALALCHAGSLPPGMTGNPAAVLRTLQMADEFGLPAQTAFSRIHVIDGKLSMSAELLLTLAIKGGVRHRWIRSDAGGVILELRRAGFDPHIETYTIEDANRAGLASKDNWRKYPLSMLRARCIAIGLRAFAPDLINGAHADEEIPPVRDPFDDGAWTEDSEYAGSKAKLIAALASKGWTLDEFDQYLRTSGHPPVYACGSSMRRTLFSTLTPRGAGLDGAK